MTQDELKIFTEQVRQKLDIEQRIGKRLKRQLSMCKERKDDLVFDEQIKGLEIAISIYEHEVKR